MSHLRVEFDTATAARLAEFFETRGMSVAAIQVQHGVCQLSPYDVEARKQLAAIMIRSDPGTVPGSLERARALLHMTNAFPIAAVRDAYLENLALLLRGRPKRSRPGVVALGLGTGRCGSTTLASALAAVRGVCATHENPPVIYWNPAVEQVEFHFARLRCLADYFDVVFDASHAWLNVVPRFFDEFPAGKVVALRRDTASCVRSFLHIKGRGRGSANHWAPPENGIWQPQMGDMSYPSYPLPPGAAADPDAAKAAMIERYVVEYNQTLAALADRYPQRTLSLDTQSLSTPETARRLTAYLGVPVSMATASLNVGHTADSDLRRLLF
jgi:hypothetical protein